MFYSDYAIGTQLPKQFIKTAQLTCSCILKKKKKWRLIFCIIFLSKFETKLILSNASKTLGEDQLCICNICIYRGWREFWWSKTYLTQQLAHCFLGIMLQTNNTDDTSPKEKKPDCHVNPRNVVTRPIIFLKLHIICMPDWMRW